MEERLRFVARLLDGEGMSAVCRQFGTPRKTGYKIWDRYRQEGLDALTDRSPRPVRHANQLPDQIERLIVETKQDKPHWGARKIRELLVRKLAGDVRIPAKSTVHAVLDRHGLVKRARQRRRCKAEGTPLSQAIRPNDLWCADPRLREDKLQRRVQDGRRPLLLPPDGHRPGLALCSCLRGP
jgi:transposase